MKTAISAAIIRDRKLLIVNKRGAYILPGGKPEKGEENIACLVREISEELSGARIMNLEYYKTVLGRTPHKGYTIEVKLYRGDLDVEEPRASAEIEEAFFTGLPEDYNLSEVTRRAITHLREDGIL